MIKKRYFLTLSIIFFLLPACRSKVPATLPAPIMVTATSVAVKPQESIPEPPSLEINSSLRFERLGLESGLSQSVIRDIIQDSKGFMWFATEDGLNRYDGYDVKIFRPDPENPNSLTDRWITSLYEDSQGYLWVGTRQGGLNQYNPTNGQFTHFFHDPENKNSLSSNNVTDILQDYQGNLWIGTNNGLDRLDLHSKNFYHYHRDNLTGLSSDSISVLFLDSRNSLWVGTSDSGLNQLDTKTGIFTNYRYNPQDIVRVRSGEINSISNNNIRDIVEDAKGNLWIATEDGLNYFNTQYELFTLYQYSSRSQFSLNDNDVYSLLIDSSGGLWVGTNKGLNYRIENSERFAHFSHDPGDIRSLSNNLVISLYEDEGGILWLGTSSGGVNKFNRGQSKFTYYRSLPQDLFSLSSNLISPIYIDRTGIVWIGTHGGGLNRFDPSTNLFYRSRHDPTNSSSLLSDEIFSIFKDSNDRLWIGTSRGLSRLNSGGTIFTHFIHDPTNKNSISGGAVRAILEDSEGNLWLGTSDGLDLYDRSADIFVHYKHDANQANSLSSNAVMTLYEDHDKNLWVGTFDKGLNRFDRETGTFVSYQQDREDGNTLSDNSVTAIYQDTKERFWVATAGGGLNRYHPETNTFQCYTGKHGLPNNVVNGILEDEFGQLWLSTNFGLSRFNPETETFRNYTINDGLQSNEFSSGSFAKAADGRMYFGGINGLNAFYPSEVRDNTYVPPVILTSFIPGGESDPKIPQAEVLQQVTVGWPNNDFSFEIAALSYAEPSRNQYAYVLEDFDKSWNYIGTNREGRYTNLSGGTYTLRFMGTNNDGVWSESDQTIQIIVIPPFWQTWAFRILVTMVVVAFSVLLYSKRMRNIQNQNLQLELTVQERTKALQKRGEEMAALYSGDEKIIRAITLDQIFQAIVEIAVKMLHADRSVVFVWSRDQSQVIPLVSHGFKPETLKVLYFEKGEGLVGRVLDNGETLIISDLDAEMLRPDVRAAIVSENIRSLVHLPIKVDEEIIGIFNVSFTDTNPITTDTVRLFTALVQRAALSAKNMQLFEQTKELAVIEERNRVARDLHDSAKQKAFAALAQLGAANGIMKNDPTSAWTHLGEAENLVYEVIQELTFLIQEMYPMALKEKGLPTTLREYIFEWENRNGVMIDLLIEDPQRMSLDKEQALYRIVQESLANVARHSQADRVDVSLIYNSDAVSLTVKDNGLGFNANKRPGGMGLRTIRERVESIGGQSCIESEPGQGTKVMIKVPLNGHK